MKKYSRSAKIFELLPKFTASDNPGESPKMTRSRNKAGDSNSKKQHQISLRPRFNQPTYAPPDTSIDNSFDTTINEKYTDETYVPSSTDDSTANSSLCSTSNPNLSKHFNETYFNKFNDSSKSNFINNDYIENLPLALTNVMGSTVTKHIETPQVMINSLATCSSLPIDIVGNDTVEGSYSDKVIAPLSISTDSFLELTNVLANDSNNSSVHYTSTTQPLCSFPIDETATVSLKPNLSTCLSSVPKSDIPNSPNDSSSEFDDSDRDATFHPTLMESSTDPSDREESFDTPSDAECQTINNKEKVFTLDHKEQRDDILNNAEDQTQRRRQRLNEINTANTTDESLYKTTRVRTKDVCFFCETEVLNFARHIIRNHTMEPEVQKILSYPKKSQTRKHLFTTLRKKGNYIANVSKCVKPMKKSNIYPFTDYLPCEKCLGFYSRKQLWKHKKLCQPLSGTSNTQVGAQNFMLRNLNIDKKLKNEVFPKMRADRVSLEAKKDPLICAFGAQYLRIHREKHFINVTSRKMRELAKLLIELKKLKPFKDLVDCLRPQNYDLIVTATKIVSSYDDKTDRYEAPTYAMNISTSLKQCCNIAIMMTLKSDSSLKTATMEVDFKTLIQLIEANWKFDVSSQACNDLNLKKWNKITIVPLASDLKLLKNYLRDTAKTAASKLEQLETIDVEAFNSLLETVYCRLILLNRRRPGELQRLFLSTYQECNNDINNYEEFDRAISSTEKMLIKNFKRIVIRGKRGRGVPVLISDDVQSDINLLISVRRKYISDNNNYLFAKAGHETPLCGYKVLEKYAKSCGAKNPKAITTTKLRKHLATLTQMLNLKDTDIEQLATFMGHTQAVHRQNYRLPDDVYQTAKISKLLLLMESGNADCYKGKTLDDIDIDLEQDLLQEARDEADQDDDIIEYDDLLLTEQSSEMNKAIAADTQEVTPLCDVTNAPKITKKKKRNLVPWSSQQKTLVLKFFNKHVKSKQPPKRHECEELRSQYPDILQNKDWLKIKVFIQNTYTKKK